MKSALTIFCCLGAMVVLGAPWSKENSAWNVNMESRHIPSSYRGEWPNHTYFPSPADWRQLAIYQLITDRFVDGDPRNNEALEGGFDIRDMTYRHGGDFVGLKSKLHYIKGLGCTGIWISPVFQSSFNGYHQYSSYDFTLLDRRLGTLDELRGLVAEAHKLDMYVMVDLVMNHMNDFFYFEGYRGKTTPFRVHNVTRSHLSSADGSPEYRLVPKTAHANLFASGKWCGSGDARWQEFGNRTTGMLASRDDCEDQCAGDPGCFYYLWKDDPGADVARHCAGFGYCSTTTNYAFGIAHVFQLKTTAWQINKWCGSEPLWQKFSDERSGILSNQSSCRTACQDFDGCSYYLWKSDTLAEYTYHCAFFSDSACESLSDYAFGAAKIYHVAQDAVDQHRCMFYTPAGKQPYADFWYNNTWVPNARYSGPEYDLLGRPFGEEGSCAACSPYCKADIEPHAWTCTNDGGYGTYDGSDFHHNGDIAEYDFVFENLFGKIYGVMDDLRLGNRRVQAKYIAMTKSLMSSTDIDGFRVDTPMQVPLAFFKAWAPAVREHARSLGKNNFGIFGEFYTTLARYSTMLGRGRDSVNHTLIDNVSTMNGGIVYPYYWYYFSAMVYNMSDLSDGFSLAYRHETQQLDTWNNATRQYEYVQWTFCNNHDNWRMTSLLGSGKALRMCLALISFWPGIPLHYAGDEQDFNTPGSALDGWAREGLSTSLAWRALPTSSQGNPADRDSFDMTSPTYRYIARLNALRRAYLGNFGSAECDRPDILNDSHVVVFVRGCENSSRVLLITSFRRDTEQFLSLQVPWSSGTELVDALSAESLGASMSFQVPENQSISVLVKPLAAMLLVPVPIRQVPASVIEVAPAHDSRVDLSSGESSITVKVTFDRAMDESSLVHGRSILFDSQPAGFQCTGASCILNLSLGSVSEGFHYIEVNTSARAVDSTTLFVRFTSRFFVDKTHGKIAWPDAYAAVGLICNNGTALCHSAEGAEWFRAQNVGQSWSPWLPYSRLGRWRALSGTPVLVQYHAQGSASFIYGDCLENVNTERKRCYSSWHSNMYLKGDLNNWGNSSDVSDRQMQLVDHFTWAINVSFSSATRVKLVPFDNHWDQSYGNNQAHRALAYDLPEFDPREAEFRNNGYLRQPVMYGTEATRLWMTERGLWSEHESIASGVAGASEIWIHPDCHLNMNCIGASDQWECHTASQGCDIRWCQAMTGRVQGCWQYSTMNDSDPEMASCSPCACCQKKVPASLAPTTGGQCCVLFNDLLLNYSVYPASSGRCQPTPINSTGTNPTVPWPTSTTTTVGGGGGGGGGGGATATTAETGLPIDGTSLARLAVASSSIVTFMLFAAFQ
eukprot:TRINITY_DN7693_c0_g2_i2.p1 TRINITY_DN7693_c0_g2~~TRINITY_DN7693_c0_g2_i2.p1  ORF type:complete len:1345 (-),score=144.52 TRINITY_DN7693_c0_g2_i2:51-4085(-)